MSFSASRTSSRVSFPVSTRWAITGWVRPPNSFSNSSISRPRPSLRDSTASKMWALLIFLARRTAPFSSSR